MTIQGEFDQLASELTRIAQSTEFNGTNLLDGGLASGMSFEDGTGGENPTISIDGQTASELGVDGLTASSSAALTALDAAIDSVASTRARLGATDNRLQHAVNNLGVTRENAAAARSRLGDTDFAAETAQLARNRVLERLTLATMTQQRKDAGAALDLLG